MVQRATTDPTSYDPAFLGLAARLQPGTSRTGAGDGRSDRRPIDELMTGPQSAGTAPPMSCRCSRATIFRPPAKNLTFLPASGSLLLPILILLVTCTNVSALHAGLTIARPREIALRLVLGASRRRIVRQLVTESVLLAVTAGALALFVIWTLLRFVESNIADVHVVVDWRTILFTFVAALAAGASSATRPFMGHGCRFGSPQGLAGRRDRHDPPAIRLSSPRSPSPSRCCSAWAPDPRDA